MELHTCKNCRYYVKHFANYNGTYYSIAYGHCINPGLNLKESDKRIKKMLPCEFWQTIEIQKAEQKENIKESLRDMARRLDEIVQILKDDE